MLNKGEVTADDLVEYVQEMSEIQVYDRIVSIHTAIPMNTIKSASLTDER